MTKYLILTIAALLVALYFVGQRCSVLADDRARLKSNQSALLSDVAHYRSESGKNAASVEALTLTKSEIERNYASLKATCDDLRIKVKRLESATEVSSETHFEFRLPLRDTVIIYRDRPDTARVLDLTNPWLSIYGTIYRDSADLDVKCFDTLSIVVHRVPRRLWFIRYGTKEIRADAVNANPYSQVKKMIYVKKE